MTKRVEKISADISPEAKSKLIQLCDKFDRSRGFMLERMINKFHSETFKVEVKQDETVEKAFDIFWESGIRKLNRKKAFSIFCGICKKYKSDNPIEIAETMADDVKHRLSINQIGFDQMHPTTYLNGERWLDERVQATNAVGYSKGANADPMAGVNAALQRREQQRNNQRNEQAGLALESGRGALPYQVD